MDSDNHSLLSQENGVGTVSNVPESESTCADETRSKQSADELCAAIDLNPKEKMLLSECWRHLHVGQWEFFRALLLTFLEETSGKMSKDSVSQILKVVYDSPELFCKGSLHIGKPHAIFKLCAQLYCEICEDEEDAKNLLLDAEFRYILGDLNELYPESYSAIQELYHVFNNYQGRKQLSSAELSSDGKQFLVQLLKRRPKLGADIMGHLLRLTKPVQTSKYLCLLWCLYEALNQQVAIFELSVNQFKTGEDDDLEEDRKSFCCLLREFDLFSVIYPEQSNGNDGKTCLQMSSNVDAFRDDVEKMIIRIWQVCERGMLERNAVFFSTLCFKDTYVLRRFCQLENEFKNRILHANLTVSAENFLRLIRDRNGHLNIKELCLYAIVNKVHFLEWILVNCVHLIGCGEYIFTCRFLQDPLLCRLKPLVFLLAWSKVKTIPEVAGLCELFDRLYSGFSEGTDPELNATCKQLVCKADLVRWALRKSCSVSKDRDRRVRNSMDILRHLHKLSDLNIVQQCTSLEEVDRTQLFAILEGRVLEENASNIHVKNCPERDFNDLSLQQLHDKMLLRGFYILYDASLVVLHGTKLEQILTCVQNAKSTGENSTAFADAEAFYDARITKPLLEIQNELNRLYPITFRVEILENLFSFLFLTHMNIKDSWFDSNTTMDNSDEGYEGDDKWNETGPTRDANARKPRKKLRKKTLREEQNSFENVGSWSWDNLGNRLTNVGFLMNDLVIRDFLQCIKQSVFETSLTFSDSKGKENVVDVESSLLFQGIASSISFDTLPKHLSRLSQYVSEAQWRFQLVAESWIPKEAGMFPSSDMLKRRNCRVSSSVQLYKCASDDEGVTFLQSNKDSNVDDEDVVNEMEPSAPSAKKDANTKPVLRRVQRKKSLKSSSKLIESKGIIYKMLSSHDSLLNYCLHGNFITKAEQVIKISGMENTVKAMEVEFALGYEKAVDKLQKMSVVSSSTAKRLQRQTSVSSTVSAWDSIMRAAYSARGTLANESIVIEELLATYQVPLITEVELPELKPILANWLPEQIDWRALVRADLALVACTKTTAAQNLLQSSYSALRSSESPKISRRSRFRDFRGKGIEIFIREMLSIITKLCSEDSKHERITKYPAGEGVRGILLQGLRPLSYKHHKKMMDVFTELNTWATQLQHFLEVERSLLTDAKQRSESEEKKSTTSTSPTTSVSSDKPVGHHQVHLIYNRLCKCVTTLRNMFMEDRFARKEEKWNPNSIQRRPAYFSSLIEYVSHLNTMLPLAENDDPAISGGIFNVLQQSPTAILRHLLFDKEIAPGKLEEFAARLNVDVVRIIVEYSCPFVPVVDEDSGVHVMGDGTVEQSEIEDENFGRTKHWKPLSSQLLDYIQNRCWLLSVIIRAMTFSSKTFSDSDSLESDNVCDLAILHPVLYRFLDKRLTGDANKDSLYGLSSFVPVSIITELLEDFIKNSRWFEAVEYLKNWECQHPRVKPSLEYYRDVIFSHMASLSCDKFLPWTYALQIEDISMRTSAVLENYSKWSANGALVALNGCVASERNVEIATCIKQVEICQSITKYLPLKKIIGMDRLQDDSIGWQEIDKRLKHHESEIELLNCLFNAKKYELILQCSQCYPLTVESRTIVDDSYVLAQLQVPVIDQSTLHVALNSCIDVQQRFSICLKILDHICEKSSNAIDLLSVLEVEDFTGVDAEKFKDFIRNKIGVKIYLTLHVEEKDEYIHFVKYPHIMIEQLIIDIKIETLQIAFQEIREDLRIFPDDDCLSFQSINNILEVYAAKAVDFRVVRTFAQVKDVALSERIGRSSTFVLPTYVPLKNQWVADASVSECMICSIERFSMFNRRHHCRRCGRVVCGSCSQRKTVVNGYGDVPVRVCDECFDHGGCGMFGDPDSLERRLKARLTNVNAVHSLASVDDASETLHIDESYENNSYSDGKLSLDEIHNLTLREEFSYEQAPNIPLYLLIYDLHWDTHKSANDHLHLANTLLKFLQPISPGVPNPEVDYNLIINMLKSVLLNAKVKFSKAFDNAGVTTCDDYLGLADLFKLLVSANCKHLIPDGDLNQRETIRILRDRLIKEERWNLALEVSTKRGLGGTLGVWAAWGMVCLRAGYYSAAREKFSHCLKPLNKTSKTPEQSCALLRQILECLENFSGVNDENATVVAASLARLKNLKIGYFQTSTAVYADGKSHSKSMSEYLFYLQTYGNHTMNVAFYVRNNDYDEALKYILEQKCSAATFVEEILMESLKKGYLPLLLSKLLKMDSTLEKWSSYLLTSCRYLQNAGLLHVLYELQVFQKDYVRAAMTCINFYQARTHNYLDLHDRVPYLAQARNHLEVYAGQRQRIKSSKGHNLALSPEDLQRYLRSLDLQVEITQFLYERSDQWMSSSSNSLISFGSCSDLSVISSKSFTEALTPSDIPTVFGHSKSRAHLIVMLIMSGHTIEDGFRLAVKVLEEYRLNPISVYSLLMKRLVQNQRMMDISKVIVCMKTLGKIDNRVSDKVLLNAISTAVTHGHTGKDFDPLIKLITEETNKIEAYIFCGKLKSAYLLAVKDDKIDSVNRICMEAERIGQMPVKDLCNKWLKTKQ